MKRIEWVYTVQGRGKFPYDMLRYDRCWPASELDSYGLDADRVKDDGAVRMRGLKDPTKARWNSFGWVVEAIERQTLS